MTKESTFDERASIALVKTIHEKIAGLEAKIESANTPPIGGAIYNLEKWEAQIEILKGLLA